jgi:hypothetical protein
MPREAPVTSATLPFSVEAIVLLLHPAPQRVFDEEKMHLFILRIIRHHPASLSGNYEQTDGQI